MRAMAVRDRNPLQVGHAPAERANRLEHEPRVALEERVDERQLAAIFDEERVTRPPARCPSLWMPGASSITLACA